MRSPVILQVEVEVNLRCNLRCCYCPVSRYPPRSEHRMSDAVYDLLLERLFAIGFAGVLSFHRYNEPTLRKDLELLVARARGRLPRVRIVLYSNGTLLGEARRARLFEAGVDHIIITDHERKGYGPAPGVTVLQPGDLEISGRAGWISSTEIPSCLPCLAPSEMLVVGHQGDVYLCVQDYGRQYVMGNIVKQDIAAIWWSPQFQSYRGRLARGEREQACDLCRQCDGAEYTRPRTA